MKAWTLRDATGYEEYIELVFANTIAEAKSQGFNGVSNAVDWIDIRCNRCKPLDDCENLSKEERIIKLVSECGWHYEIGDKRYREEDIEELKTMLGVNL